MMVVCKVNLNIEKELSNRGKAVLEVKNLSKNCLESADLPKWGLDKIFVNTTGTYKDISTVNGGIIIDIVVAIIMYIILDRTIFGYELKVCGFNSSASKHAGINEKEILFYLW